MRRLHRSAALVVSLALASVALAGCADEPEEAQPEVEVIGTLTGGDPLPEATFEVLGDPERQVSMADLRGTPAVVNFWATWCAFCVEEMPDLEAAHQVLGDAVTFVGIDRQDNTERALALAEETGVTYLLLSSPDGGFYTEVKARGMPTTLLVDADGVIRYRHAGPVTTEELLDLVEEHLGVSA